MNDKTFHCPICYADREGDRCNPCDRMAAAQKAYEAHFVAAGMPIPGKKDQGGSDLGKDSNDDGLKRWEVSGVVRTVAPFVVSIVAASEEEARDLAEDEARSSLTGQSWSDVDVMDSDPEEN